MAVGEAFVQYIFREILGVEIPLPLPRLTYRDAMERFGSDKPDLRFGMELIDVTEQVRESEFSVFSGAASAGGAVKAITAPGAAAALTRKEIDRLTEFVRGVGAKGLAWARLTPDGTACSFAKFFSEEALAALLAACGAKTGDVVLFVADGKRSLVNLALGMLRCEVAKKLDLIPDDEFRFLWVTQFPFFELDEETGEYVAMHHPFTSPLEEDIPLLETDKGRVRAQAYDLVLNGVELSSGSIRITDPALQNRMFESLGLSDEEAQQKFGFLLDAFRYGAPPHGGMGIGLDRLVMLMLRCANLRDVTAFPKVQNMRDLMTECPSPVDDAQLRELHIAVEPPRQDA